MNCAVKTSLGILILLALVYAAVGKSNIDLDEQCQVNREEKQIEVFFFLDEQALQCNPSTEICRRKSKCDDSKQDDLSKCVYCALKDDLNQKTVSKTLLASSISQQQQPLAPRLLAQSGGARLLADNRGNSILSSTLAGEGRSNNKTSDELSYDDYYEYDEDETSDKNEFGEDDEYLDDYAESSDTFIKGSEPIHKLGFCPKVMEANETCDPAKILESECRFDTDCSGDQKCCEAACGKRVCNAPISSKKMRLLNEAKPSQS